MKKRMAKEKGRPWATVGAVCLFVGMLLVLIVATSRLSSGSDAQGRQATYDAIRRSAVLCYATEGYYPPSLTYIEENYGVQIDYSRYVVRYDVFASNVMPQIYVMEA